MDDVCGLVVCGQIVCEVVVCGKCSVDDVCWLVVCGLIICGLVVCGPSSVGHGLVCGMMARREVIFASEVTSPHCHGFSDREQQEKMPRELEQRQQEVLV